MDARADRERDTPVAHQGVARKLLGAAATAWLQDLTSTLSAQGLPFCVSGIGDLLALFRCISCRYTFSLSWDEPDLMGAPGRVVCTGEVGTACALPCRPLP